MFWLNWSTCWSNWEDLLHHVCLWESSLASATGSVLLVAAYHQLNSYTTSKDIDVSTLSSSITLSVLVLSSSVVSKFRVSKQTKLTMEESNRHIWVFYKLKHLKWITLPICSSNCPSNDWIPSRSKTLSNFEYLKTYLTC